MSDEKKIKENIRKGVKIALTCIEVLCTSASAICPFFGPAGSICKVILKCMEDNGEGMLGEEFEKVNQELQNIYKANQDVLNEIKKQKSDYQLSEIEFFLKKYFNALLNIEKARPEDVEKETEKFIEMYKGRQEEDLLALCKLVVGNVVYGDPILKVCKTWSKGDKAAMMNLCDHLRFLLSIGVNCYMFYLTVTDAEDIEEQSEKWRERLTKANRKMEQAIRECR